MTVEGRGFDKVSAAMALVTTVMLAWAAWLRFGPPPAPEAPAVGASAPALRLVDLSTSEPLVLLGLKGKVVWITFFSVAAPPPANDLTALEAVWKRFKLRPRFAMAALDVESDRPDRLRAAVAAAGTTMPTYLAAPETCRAFGVDLGRLPLHILLDPSGRVAAVAQGRGAPTLNRLGDQAERWLDEVEPLGKTRFASASESSPLQTRPGPIDLTGMTND
jgi:hypothetical protein